MRGCHCEGDEKCVGGAAFNAAVSVCACVCVIVWARRGVCGWGILHCCSKVWVCVFVCVCVTVGVYECACVGEEGSVLVGHP